jgi:hypothetical protein
MLKDGTMAITVRLIDGTMEHFTDCNAWRCSPEGYLTLLDGDDTKTLLATGQWAYVTDTPATETETL